MTNKSEILSMLYILFKDENEGINIYEQKKIF